MILTDEQIEALCHKAERVVITGDSSHKDIGIKVGSYSQSCSISARFALEDQERTIRRLQTDLVMMNQKEEWQRKKAKEAQENQ